jgi:hypothetical protein
MPKFSLVEARAEIIEVRDDLRKWVTLPSSELEIASGKMSLTE